MEPVFMILGQSAATAAGLAIDDRVPVQDIQYVRLRSRLLADGQVLDWTKPKPNAKIDGPPHRLAGQVLCPRW